ncbi:hypothetical protein P8452_05569 [Trifolium repens]|nr:hypothetical protein P8452_05569 [Trifolium repens]
MATPSTTNKLTLKLLIDRKNDKVLFAEASKAVVDFLFSLLCLPIGTVVKLLGNNDMVGSIGNLYNSVENLNHNYIQPDQTKDVFLNPSAPVWSVHISSCLLPMQEGILNTSSGISSFLVAAELDNEDDEEDMEEELESDFEDDEEEDEMEESDSESEYEEDDEDNLGEETFFYTCPSISHGCCDVTCDKTTLCPRCNLYFMNREMCYVGEEVDEEYISINNGFVKEDAFMVMDDLLIQPMPALSGITILNRSNIKEFGTLQEMVVDLGVDEGIKLLKASLQSKMVLTSVFLKKDI